MKCSIFILLAVLIATQRDMGDQFSIGTFLDYLQETGYYDLIYDIKCAFDTEIAIDFGLEYVGSPHCEEVVRVYMPQCMRPGGTSDKICDLTSYIKSDKCMKVLLLSWTNEEIEKKIKRLLYTINQKRQKKRNDSKCI